MSRATPIDDDGNDALDEAVPKSSSSTSIKGQQKKKKEQKQKQTVRWRDLPRKGQLAILTLARLSEPVTQTSLQSYMFYQLRSFDPSLPSSAIASQIGVLQGCFTFAQFMTAFLWGRFSDNAAWGGGRKRVILIGLLGTGISCVGFGFSKSFVSAVVFRSVGGMLNGNVGVMKTMISEIIVEKKFQSRAFLLMPMCFNIGVIIGPMLGGVLADPVGSYPWLFGDDSVVGGKHGVWWLKQWPYALPNLMSAVFLLMAASAVFLGLEETLEARRGLPDWGLALGQSITNLFRNLSFTRRPKYRYTALEHADYETPPNSATTPRDGDSYELESSSPIAKSSKSRTQKITPPFRSILIPKVLITLLSHGLLAFHIGTFNALWFIFLSTPRSSTQTNPPKIDNRDTEPHYPLSFLHFTGGLALTPATIGLALAILGSIGLPLQILLYPRLTSRFGTLTCYRLALLCFPIAHTLAPFLAILPTSHPSPHAADGPAIWAGLITVLSMQVLGRTFALPGATILVNNSSPSPAVLGTVHGVAQSVTSGARTLGPLLGAWGFGKGLDAGVVGAVWWCLAAWGLLAFGVSWFLKEGGDGEGDGDGDGVGVNRETAEDDEEKERLVGDHGGGSGSCSTGNDVDDDDDAAAEERNQRP